MEDGVLIIGLIQNKSAKELPKISLVSACLGSDAVRVNCNSHVGSGSGRTGRKKNNPHLLQGYLSCSVRFLFASALVYESVAHHDELRPGVLVKIFQL